MNKKTDLHSIIVTAGSSYLDIDAYACSVAMKEFLEIKGRQVVAYSNATTNYSVCEFLKAPGQLIESIPTDFKPDNTDYVIVDVSDPKYIENNVPLENVIAVYDHHTGFEKYWEERIGSNSHIEFIGAAATLVYREWKKSGLQNEMKRATALLLIAAILDNTLNLTSGNTTSEDVDAFYELCGRSGVGEQWCAEYFSEVQKNIEADLNRAVFSDIKDIGNNDFLPPYIAQICVWDAIKTLDKLDEIKKQLNGYANSWLINVIDIRQHCSYFVCNDNRYQKRIEEIFNVCFEADTAKSSIPYLRKEIIKKSNGKG